MPTQQPALFFTPTFIHSPAQSSSHTGHHTKNLILNFYAQLPPVCVFYNRTESEHLLTENDSHVTKTLGRGVSHHQSPPLSSSRSENTVHSTWTLWQLPQQLHGTCKGRGNHLHVVIHPTAFTPASLCPEGKATSIFLHTCSSASSASILYMLVPLLVPVSY